MLYKNMDDLLLQFERKFFSKVEMSPSYHQAALQCVVIAVLYAALGFAYLGLNQIWKTIYCFKQAGRFCAFSYCFELVSKLRNEPKSEIYENIELKLSEIVQEKK